MKDITVKEFIDALNEMVSGISAETIGFHDQIRVRISDFLNQYSLSYFEYEIIIDQNTPFLFTINQECEFYLNQSFNAKDSNLISELIDHVKQETIKDQIVLQQGKVNAMKAKLQEEINILNDLLNKQIEITLKP